MTARTLIARFLALAALVRREPGSVVLRHERTPTDLRDVTARFDSVGDLIVEGHDLGKGVESLSSYREYEWTVTVAAADTPKLAAALQGGEMLHLKNLLRLLQRRFSGGEARQLEPFLKEKGIPFTFWNRVGD